MTRRPTLVVGLDVAADELERRIRARAEEMFERGVVDEVRAALAAGVSRTAEKALGLREIAELEPRRGARAHRRPHAALRRLPAEVDAADPGLVVVDAGRDPAAVARDVIALARR